ncbi:MAG: thioesterase family protein [Candidatus Delongbacteria bacterium]|jgi:fluoroacetyl-CoA thioesterase|nr:thioesterase family protein [Candidatus Delongbacteria bacterium]
MEISQLHTGIKGNLSQTITKNDTASLYGSGLVEAFATPAMVAFMENTCLQSIEPYLPDTHSSVGIKISVTHEKATPVGMYVYCTSRLVEIDRKRLVFEVEARDEQGIIGKGQHERFIIDKEKFIKKLHSM